MNRLTWYVRRLRSMSSAEIAWRASRVTTGAVRTLTQPTEPSDAALLGVANPDWDALLRQFRAGAGQFRAQRRDLTRPILLDGQRATTLAAAHPEETAAVLAAADRTLAHRFTFFSYPEQVLADPIDWHYDPVSATTWPTLRSDRIDHRTSPADPKWIWELNRLQHLPWLAHAWLITGEDRYAEGALDQLDSWLAQNPPGIGIAWRGAFEAGIRAISVALALQGLRDAPALTPDRYRRLVRMLAESARRCWQDRSRFSSANNHLVGELAGAATVALLFPELAAAQMWQQRALRALNVEAQRQILPDGAGAEQAIGYQVFTADLLLIVVALVRLRGDQAPPGMLRAIDRSATFLATLVGDGDPTPHYGDDDEGFALRLDAAPLRTVPDHLAAVATVTGNPTARRAGRQPGLGAGWFAAAPPTHATPVTPAMSATPVTGKDWPGSYFAPHGGLVVLRSGPRPTPHPPTSREPTPRRVTMDVGPLGYLSIAAHGHADALAVTLSVDGHELIGDPGTASYYGHPEWRTVHRSTRAHATVCVDDTDQSVMGGPFMWTEHATVTIHAVDLDRGIVDAEHEGYRRLRTPVTHRRWLFAPADATTVLVVDLLQGDGTHRVRTSWPLHPSLDATRTDDGHLVTRDGSPVLHLGYAASTPWRHHDVRGDPVTNLGWWSHRLESREPAWVVGSWCAAPLPIALVTVLMPVAMRPLTGSDR